MTPLDWLYPIVSNPFFVEYIGPAIDAFAAFMNNTFPPA